MNAREATRPISTRRVREHSERNGPFAQSTRNAGIRRESLIPQFLESLYLGPDVSTDEAKRASDAVGIKHTRPANPARQVAELLAAGKVVGPRCRTDGIRPARARQPDDLRLMLGSLDQQVAQPPIATHRVHAVCAYHPRKPRRRVFPELEGCGRCSIRHHLIFVREHMPFLDMAPGTLPFSSAKRRTTNSHSCLARALGSRSFSQRTRRSLSVAEGAV